MHESVRITGLGPVPGAQPGTVNHVLLVALSNTKGEKFVVRVPKKTQSGKDLDSERDARLFAELNPGHAVLLPTRIILGVGLKVPTECQGAYHLLKQYLAIHQTILVYPYIKGTPLSDVNLVIYTMSVFL